jgi:hypothetical protein
VKEGEGEAWLALLLRNCLLGWMVLVQVLGSVKCLELHQDALAKLHDWWTAFRRLQ